VQIVPYNLQFFVSLGLWEFVGIF